MDIIIENKVKLIQWLSGEEMIIQHVHSHKLITINEYAKIQKIQDPNVKMTELVDIILKKGQSRCMAFLELLKKDEVNESRPELREWITTVNTSGASVPKEGKCRDESDPQNTSLTTRPVPSVATHNQDLVFSEELLFPPSYFRQPRSTMHFLVTSVSGDALQGNVACVSLFHTQNLTKGDKDLSFPGSNQINTLKLDQYDMSGDWRGIALIINNVDFLPYSSLGKRLGSDMDEESLVAVFQWLGFEIVKRKNCTRDSMLRALDELRMRDHSQADCVVCCVLTHGFEGGLRGVDGEGVWLREVLEKLDNHHCPSLIQKPKIFFIQACQGSNYHQTALLQSDGSTNTSDMDQVQSIPVRADYLVAMATMAGYVSFRETTRGTWFIQSLCKNLQLLVPSGIDLLSILTEVNKEVSNKSDKTGTKKQMPQPEFTLTKRVVFPIPKTPPPCRSPPS